MRPLGRPKHAPIWEDNIIRDLVETGYRGVK
jgi:hypothetical protein